MKLLSDIRLRWYDESSSLIDDRRELMELFLNSIGAKTKIAADIFEVLLIARSRDIAITSADIKNAILDLRRQRNEKDIQEGLTNRNIQLWLKFFRELGLIDMLGKRYRFTGNKIPSEAFLQYTRPIIDSSADFVYNLLKNLESHYGLK